MPENDITELQTLDIYQLTENQYAELLESSEFDQNALYMTPASNAVTSVNGKIPSANGNVDVVALPTGGTAGQALYKDSSVDGDASWGNLPTVDQTYSSASTNAQSGTAVASAVSELKVIVITSSSFSSLPQTITDSSITANHVVINSVLSNPSAQTGDWTVTTSSGSLTISGSINGSTTVTLYLALS